MTLVEVVQGSVGGRDAAALVAAQVAGGGVGVVLANLMFDLDAVAALDPGPHRRRTCGSAEVVATFGLVLVVFGSLRTGRPEAVAFAVGGYITAAYWFTSSTSFANPAVTVARMFSDTFAGIAPASVPAFVALPAGRRRARLAAVRCAVPAPPDHPREGVRRMTRPAQRPVRLRAQRRPFPDGRGLPRRPGRRPDRGALRRQSSPPTRSTRSPSRRWPRWASTSTSAQPKVLTTEAVQDSDVVITMGCGDACPFFPGKRYEDWELDDPAGQGIDAVRPIRDEIRTRVQALVSELL